MPETPGADDLNLLTERDLGLLQLSTVLYYLHESNPDNGLVRDKTDPNAPVSIAACGMALATIPAGTNMVVELTAPAIEGLIISSGVTINSIVGVRTDRGDGLNTTGYRFNARSNSDRRQLVGRMDYYLNARNNVTGTYNYTFEKNDRTDVTARFYDPIPPNFTSTK